MQCLEQMEEQALQPQQLCLSIIVIIYLSIYDTLLEVTFVIFESRLLSRIKLKSIVVANYQEAVDSRGN